MKADGAARDKDERDAFSDRSGTRIYGQNEPIERTPKGNHHPIILWVLALHRNKMMSTE